MKLELQSLNHLTIASPTLKYRRQKSKLVKKILHRNDGSPFSLSASDGILPYTNFRFGLGGH